MGSVALTKIRPKTDGKEGRMQDGRGDLSWIWNSAREERERSKCESKWEKAIVRATIKLSGGEGGGGKAQRLKNHEWRDYTP